MHVNSEGQWRWATFLTGDNIEYSRKEIYNFKLYRIEKGEIVCNISCLQVFNLAPVGSLRSATDSSVAAAR